MIWRFAAAIALQSLALTIWQIGRRSPLEALRAIVRGLRDGRTFFVGTIAFVLGAVFAVSAALLVVPILSDGRTQIAPTIFFVTIVAATIDLLVGDDVRALVTR